MEFKHLSQDDFKQERAEAVEEILDKDWWRDESESTKVVCRRSYNEGFKQALRKLKYQRPPLDGSDYDELIEEVDKIDKEA